MGLKERERLSLETRIELLRKLEVAAAAEEPVNLRLLAAIRELLMEAEIELRE